MNQNTEQTVRIVREGPGTANAEATLAALSPVVDDLPGNAKLEQIMSRIQTDPSFSCNVDVVGFLASVGNKRLRLEGGNCPLMHSLFKELPKSTELVASLEFFATGEGTPPSNCNPLRTWLGTGVGIPNQVGRAVQQSTLEKMLNAPGNIIELDLDMTTLMPIVRILNALRQTGALYNIKEFTEPQMLSMLPGYTGGGFNDFLNRFHIGGETLPEKYPDLDWQASDLGTRGDLYSSFRAAYWSGDLGSDQVIPGLADFIVRAKSAGKMVIFVSGRSSAWADGSVEALKHGGVDVDYVFSDENAGADAPFGSVVLLIGQLSGGDAGTKKLRQAQILRFWGKPSSFVDDRYLSVKTVEEVSNALGVHPRQLGFSAETSPNTMENAVSTFEMSSR